jgi:hypothetical protein
MIQRLRSTWLRWPGMSSCSGRRSLSSWHTRRSPAS